MERFTTPLHPDYATPFAAYLDPGEKLLWYGQPRQGIYFRKSDALMIPFTIMWGGFAIFWESTALWQFHRSWGTGRAAPILFPLWGIPFVLIGLYLMVGRFFFDAYSRRRTYYGLTSGRALILSGATSQRLVSYTLSSVPEVDLTSFPDGTGTISFGPNPLGTSTRSSSNNGLNIQSNSTFERIPNAGEVYRLLREVQNGQHT